MNTTARPATVAPAPLAPLASALGSGELSVREAVEHALEHIDAHDASIHALLPEPGRRERLLREAADLERRYPEPSARPPLYGVLVGVKDIFAANGFETRAGSRLPPELFAMPEGPVVSALRRAGALILGKTVTTEFAYFAPGPTANPWNTAHTPGGSSSGSAAAVAAGFCSLALGTQTIGSISRPAAFCGISGWKPSYERTSRAGAVPFSPSLDHVGLLAPDAAGLSLAAPVIATDWSASAYTQALEKYSQRRPILIVPDGPYLAQTDAAALATFEATILRLRSAGFSIIRMNALEDIEEINARHRRIAAAEMERTHRVWFAKHARLYAEATRELILKGAAIGDDALELDRSGQLSLRRMLERALEEAGAEYWISPAALGPAPAGLDATGSPLMNLPWTHAGVPTLALPAGLSAKGLPLGIQIAGNFGSDENLLALGVALEPVLQAALAGR
jgi:Asp-tRNA(Asn)/Glu-tRNA(Gln) amidotransferase A subunit family amidase